MSKILIESTVLKMSIGKTDKDERQETSGLCTKLSFDVVGSPRSLARMANLLKQGNVNIKLVIEATNAANDVEVNTVDLPHQMGLGEQPVPPTSKANLCTKCPGFADCQFEIKHTGVEKCEAHDKQQKAESSEPGTTPVRSGEPITPATSTEESNKAFDNLKSANDNGDGNNHNGNHAGKFLDLEKLKIKVLDDNKGYVVSLDGVRKKSPDDLVGSILHVFQQSGEKAGTPDELINTLLLYPSSEMRNTLIDVLRGTKTAESLIQQIT